MSPAPSPAHAPPERRGLLGWLGQRMDVRQLTARRSLAIIIGTTAGFTVAGGVTITLLDRNDFNSLGEGMWWAVQTVTTVGYGDVVPRSTIGRVIATLVMLTGIAFISLITAAVTATLVEQARQRRQEADDPLFATLDEINSRLEAIEARLGEVKQRPGPGPG